MLAYYSQTRASKSVKCKEVGPHLLDALLHAMSVANTGSHQADRMGQENVVLVREANQA